MPVTTECVVCGRPTPDGYACVAETERARRQLLGDERDDDRPGIVDLAAPARDVAYRQTSGTGAMGSGVPGSIVPIDLGAGTRLDAVQNALTGWAREICEERGVSVDAGGQDVIVVAARFIADNLEWCRHKDWVDELLREVGDCVATMRSVATRHREPDEIVGACECERILYAKAGRTAVTCPDCEIVWDVAEARDELRDRLNGKLVTAAQAAHLGVYLDTDRTSEQIRKLVNKWASRGRLEERGLNGAHPTYRFGDIADLIAASPRRVAATTPA